MTKVGLVYDPVYLEHDTGAHPESAHRLTNIVRLLEQQGTMERTVPIPRRRATVDEVATVHSTAYVSQVEAMAGRGGGWIDGDTVVCPASYDVALFAVGGLLNAVDAVMSGDVASAFALVRPPGHHAMHTDGAGFCLFNNIAVATMHAFDAYHLQRVLIVDFDVHHGNGTQDTFYADPRVLYFSVHQYPFYPGTGRLEETGAGAGEGTTINVPLPAWCGDDEYLRVFEEILVPVAKRFQPEVIMVSAGYDAHWGDRLAQMALSVGGYAEMARILHGLAGQLCQGRLILTLEGGYLYEALASSIQSTISILSGKPEVIDPLGKPTSARKPPPIDGILQYVRQLHQVD
ncbi:MAG: histone deacetylase [Chloroflexota bacterium]